MNLQTYLRAIRKSWWLVALAVVLGIAAGVYRNASATPIYGADVTFYVSTAASAQDSAVSGDQFAQSRAVSYAKLLSSDALAKRVKSAENLPLSVDRLTSELSGSADLNTVFVTATIDDPSRAQALQIARGVAAQFPKMVDQFDNRTAGSGSIKLMVTSGPSVGSAPVLPRTGLNLLYGFAAGLVLGLLLAVLRFLRDTSIRHRDDIELVAGVPVIGTIVDEPAARKQPLVLDQTTPSSRGEEFRQLRTGLQFVAAAKTLQTLVVTSSGETEGKSSTAANLALVFAESGRSVLLIDADLRRPRAAQYFGLEGAIGLSNVLADQIPLDAALQSWREGSLSLLASGSIPPNPSELLGGESMIELLQHLRERFDLIIIDTPPLLPVTDAAVLAAHADGVLMVCRYGRTKRAHLATAARALETVDARLVGAVLNMHPVRGMRRSGYRYYGEKPASRRVRRSRERDEDRVEDPAVGVAGSHRRDDVGWRKQDTPQREKRVAARAKDQRARK